MISSFMGINTAFSALKIVIINTFDCRVPLESAGPTPTCPVTVINITLALCAARLPHEND